MVNLYHWGASITIGGEPCPGMVQATRDVRDHILHIETESETWLIESQIMRLRLLILLSNFETETFTHWYQILRAKHFRALNFGGFGELKTDQILFHQAWSLYIFLSLKTEKI